MQFKYRLPFALFATVAVAVCHLQAQADDEEEDEFSSMGFYSQAPQALSVHLKLSQGPKVKFGDLGNMPVILALPASGVIGRTYMDGSVNVDAPRPYVAGDPHSEFSADGNRLSPTGGRYQVYDSRDSTILRGDYLSYTPGLTRSWSYNNASQTTTKPGYMAFDIYNATTQGASFTGSRRYTGGFELSVSRDITNPNKRVRVSIVAGVSINGISSSKAGTVNSTLNTYTDFYSLNGLAAPITPATSTQTVGVIYSGPSFVTINGVDTESTGAEAPTALTLSTLPDGGSNNTSQTDGAVVTGLWKLKGAYFTLKLGPQVTALLTRTLALNASVGVAGSYVGTTYSATESFSVVGMPNALTTGVESSNKNTALPGYYANLDATWTLNERTGLFAGVSYDNLGEYNQSVGGRTAKIDLSATAGVRGGISIKF